MDHTDTRDLTRTIVAIGRIGGSAPAWCRGLPIVVGNEVETVDGIRHVAVAYLPANATGLHTEAVCGDWWMCDVSAVVVSVGAMPAGTCDAVHPSGALERECTGAKGHRGDHPWRL